MVTHCHGIRNSDFRTHLSNGLPSVHCRLCSNDVSCEYKKIRIFRVDNIFDHLRNTSLAVCISWCKVNVSKLSDLEFSVLVKTQFLCVNCLNCNDGK